MFAEIIKGQLSIDADDLSDAMREKLVKNLPLVLKLDPEALTPEAREAIERVADRVGALGGTLTILSPAGGGTRIHAETPCA